MNMTYRFSMVASNITGGARKRLCAIRVKLQNLCLLSSQTALFALLAGGAGNTNDRNLRENLAIAETYSLQGIFAKTCVHAFDLFACFISIRFMLQGPGRERLFGQPRKQKLAFSATRS